MKQYQTLEIIRLSGGTIGLTDEQAARRPRALRQVRKGLYEIIGPVEFKRGEEIGLVAPGVLALPQPLCLDQWRGIPPNLGARAQRSQPLDRGCSSHSLDLVSWGTRSDGKGSLAPCRAHADRWGS